MSTRFILLAYTLVAATISSPAQAQNPSPEMHELRQQLLSLSQRLEVLEASSHEVRAENERLADTCAWTALAVVEVTEETAAVSSRPSESSAASWAERIRLQGDFRFRYEHINQQGKADRKRERIRAKADSGWEFGYSYIDREKAATLGLFVDSDFGGGRTDNRGHVLNYSYAIEKNWNAGITYFINETGQSSGENLDYNRLQADLVFKYRVKIPIWRV